VVIDCYGWKPLITQRVLVVAAAALRTPLGAVLACGSSPPAGGIAGEAKRHRLTDVLLG
jgi:hypothetical protein